MNGGGKLECRQQIENVIDADNIPWNKSSLCRPVRYPFEHGLECQ